MRVFLILALFGLLVAPAQAAKPVGFQTDLSDGQHIECGLTGSTLSCLNYTETPSRACDFGGAVAGKVLTKNATKPRVKTFCVDEGYHDWTVLTAGRTWKHGAFSCRVRKGAAGLTCTNTRGKHVLWSVSA